RRNHEEADPGEDEQGEREDDGGRVSALQAASLERLDCGIQRYGEQRRDEDPRQDRPGEEHQEKRQAHEYRDTEDEKDRLGANDNDTHLGSGHAGEFGATL